MATIDVYIDECGCERKRRRRRWLLPIFVGLAAALSLGRENPPMAPPVAPPPAAASPFVEPPAVTAAPVIAPPVEPAPLPARLAVAPARLDFGDGPLTRSVPARLLTVRNEGGQPLDRVKVTIDGPFLATNGCDSELAPGHECMIAVVFAPQEPGGFTGSLKIVAGGEQAKIPLGGRVPRPAVVVQQPPAPAATPPVSTVPPPPPVPPQPPPEPPPARILCFHPPLLRFATTGKQAVTLTNPEPVPLSVVAILPVGGEGQTLSGYEIDARRCLRVLNPGEQCRFTVRANRRAVQTAETMQVKVYYDDPVTGTRRTAQFSQACGR